MKRERVLLRRLHTLATLEEAVTAMKSLAAHHFRVCRQVLPAAQAYRQEIDAAFAAIAVQQTINWHAPRGLLLVASDLGLCGDYNTRLVATAAEQVAAEQCAAETNDHRTAYPLYCIGRRATALLQRRGLSPTRAYPAPASADGLPGLLIQLAEDLLDDWTERTISGLFAISGRFEGAGKFTPVLTPVLPLDAPSALQVTASQVTAATSYEPRRHLVAVAIREFLYTTLYELLLDALAAEHGMRLVAAESARRWLDETATTVRRQLAAARREASTQEVLDIVAGSRQKGVRYRFG